MACVVDPLEGGVVSTAGGQVLLGWLVRRPSVDCVAHGSKEQKACAPEGVKPASKPLSAPCITCQAGLSWRLLRRAGAGANRTCATQVRTNAIPGRSSVQVPHRHACSAAARPA